MAQYYTDVITLDILRGIQGIGAAATIPASVCYLFLYFIVQNLDTSFDFMQLGILAHTFPPSRARSLAFATFSAGAPVGAVFGSALGSVLTEFTQ